MPIKENILPFESGLKNKKESKDEKILRLQKLVDQGLYKVDSEELAEAVLDSDKTIKGSLSKIKKKR